MTSMVLFALPKLIVNPVNVRRGWNSNIDEVAPKMMLSAYGMQIYFPGKVIWSTKAIHLRNPPSYRIYNPTPAQIQARIALGKAARGHRGAKGLLPLGEAGKRLPKGATVPAVAALIQPELKRKTYGAVYKGGYHRGPHTLEELETMASGLPTLAAAARAAGPR